MNTIQAELKRQLKFMIDYQIQMNSHLPTSLNVELKKTLACVCMCYRHIHELDFKKDGYLFDWLAFEHKMENLVEVEHIIMRPLV